MSIATVQAARVRVRVGVLQALVLAASLVLGLLGADTARAQCDPTRACCRVTNPGGDPGCAGAGNPIHVITGNKYQHEVDLPALPGVLGLEIVRHYNSAYSTPASSAGMLGRGWRLGYETELIVSGNRNRLTVVQADGALLHFVKGIVDPSRYITTDPAHGSLAASPRGAAQEYVWSRTDGHQWSFNAAGKLVQIKAPTGEFVSLTRDPQGALVRVIDPQGRSLQLNYGSAGASNRLQSIDSPVGRFVYEHGSASLAKVTQPDKVSRNYHYEDKDRPGLLTGISIVGTGSDGRAMNQRIGTYGYDATGRGILSVKGEPARWQTDKDGKRSQVEGTGIEQITLEYGTGKTTLTNSLGQKTVYTHATIAGENRLLEVRGAGCATCSESNVRYGHDKQGRVTEVTKLDDNGKPVQTTRTQFDPYGRPVSVSRVVYRIGKPEAPQQLVRYEYSGQAFQPSLIARPSVVPGREHTVRIVYNDAGQPLQVSESGFSPIDDTGNLISDGVPINRTTTYTYSRINGRSVLSQIDGPLANGPKGDPSDSDITRYQWDARADAVRAITHPMGLTAQFEYDSSGRVQTYTGVDGVATTLAYTPTGALTQVERAGAIVTYRQDALDRTSQVITAIGQRMQFGYDSAGHMVSVNDPQGNRIQLLRNAEGELTQKQLLDPDGSVSQQGRDFVSREGGHAGAPSRDPVLAAVRQLLASAQGSASIARPDLAAPFAALHNFIAGTEALDAHDRAAASTALDSQGRTTTSYSDDFGRLVLVQSPATGTTRYTYNAADQLIARITHDGSRAEYGRDAAGRMVSVEALSADGKVDEHATIAWGRANKPVHITYAAGEERFAYDAAGRLVEHTQGIDGKRLTLKYQYDAAGRLVAKTLPSGQTLSLRYRGAMHPRAGLLESVWLNGNRLTAGVLDRPIVQGINDENDRYSQRGFVFGNGLTNQLRLDAYGRVTSAGNAQVGQTQLSYESRANDIDPASVTTQRSVLLNQRAQREAAQALISRINGLRGGASQPVAADIQTLAGVQQDRNDARIDGLGRQVTQGPARFVYDSLNRLVEVRRAGVTGDESVLARYRYNLFGQRIAKTTYSGPGSADSKITYYFHDGSHLVAEADAQGGVGKQYVWVNDKPVALLQGGHVYAVHTDHRNAPLALTDEARQVVWQAQVADFGNTTEVQGSPGSGLGSIEFNLRLSNQYYDAETGLHYNTHRYYDPVAARYLTPDPLGLAAGPDLHAFALNRPHTLGDPLGLQPAPTNRDVSGWSTSERLRYVFEHAADRYPGELGDALRELVSPTALATTAVVFGVWAAAQFTPYGWAADIAIAGIGYLFLGNAVWNVISSVVETSLLIANARCESDLRRGGDTLARGLGQAVAASAGGAAAAGASRVATLMRRIFRDAAPTTVNRATAAAVSESWFGRFTPGRTRSGAVENAEFVARRSTPGNAAYPPWAANRSVVDTWLNPGQRIYMVNYRNAAGPGGWATPRQFTNMADARRQLPCWRSSSNPVRTVVFCRNTSSVHQFR